MRPSPLKEYNRKRDFAHTPEPTGKPEKQRKGALRFVVQLHQASRLHYDFRLEAGGVLKSWAVPKGPTLDSSEQRLAVQVEDHPVPYGDFEGIIPKGNYGAGTVMIWDEGTYTERSSEGLSREKNDQAVLEGIEKRHITVVLQGKKLHGEFALVGLKGDDGKPWLLIKKRDEFATRKPIPHAELSVKTGRNLQEIAAQAEAKGDVWLPGQSLDANQSRGAPAHEVPPPPPPAQKFSRSSGVARTEKFPRKSKPMLATPWPKPFEQKGWIFEYDPVGHRALAELERGGVRLYSRQHLPFEGKYPEIVEALRSSMKAAQITAILDGEIVQDQNSKENVYWVRDLLHLEGKNLRGLPLLERKKLLSELPLFGPKVFYVPHEMRSKPLVTRGEFPAILARDGSSFYQEGTSKQWLRIPLKVEKKDTAPRLTHLKKILWPQEKITKGDLIDYYRKVAPFLVPFLADRPESMHRHPHGIEKVSFFHKDLLEHHPRWVETERVFSASGGKSINYVLCQNEFTLLYMVNLGCIEINPWLSRRGSLDRPDFIVIDLDPADSNPFEDVVKVAQEIHHILDRINVPHYGKTSGATGFHIYIPTQAQYSYEKGRDFALKVCANVHQLFPDITSLERSPSKRRGKIYLDCFQNAEGQTVAAPYSVRPRPGATVSTPLLWKEVTKKLDPRDFTLETVPKRLDKMGDLWADILKTPSSGALNLEAALVRLNSKFPKNSKFPPLKKFRK